MSLEELRKVRKEEKPVFGSELTIKKLKLGKVKKVFLASNCPKTSRDDIEHYAKMSNIEIINLKEPNDELAMVCKKPFAVSVVSC